MEFVLLPFAYTYPYQPDIPYYYVSHSDYTLVKVPTYTILYIPK